MTLFYCAEPDWSRTQSGSLCLWNRGFVLHEKWLRILNWGVRIKYILEIKHFILLTVILPVDGHRNTCNRPNWTSTLPQCSQYDLRVVPILHRYKRWSYPYMGMVHIPTSNSGKIAKFMKKLVTPKSEGSYFGLKHLEQTTLSCIHFIENAQAKPRLHYSEVWCQIGQTQRVELLSSSKTSSTCFRS